MLNSIGVYAEGSGVNHIGVYDAKVNLAPSFTSSPITSVIATTPYSYTVTAIDANSPQDALTISANASPALPAWLSLVDNGDGTALLSGTPALGNIGSYNVTLTVTDTGGLSDTQSFTITVSPVPIKFYNARFTLELPGSILVAAGANSEQNVVPPSSSQTTSDGKTNSSFTVELP